MEFDTGYKLSPQTSRPNSRRFTSGYLEWYIAGLDGVQGYLDEITFKMRTKAEEDLRQASVEHPSNTGNSYITSGDAPNGLDRYIELNDERGEKAALSIEYGHGAYIVVDPTGHELYRVGASKPLWILHNATHLPKRARMQSIRKVVSRRKKRRKR